MQRFFMDMGLSGGLIATAAAIEYGPYAEAVPHGPVILFLSGLVVAFIRAAILVEEWRIKRSERRMAERRERDAE